MQLQSRRARWSEHAVPADARSPKNFRAEMYRHKREGAVGGCWRERKFFQRTDRARLISEGWIRVGRRAIRSGSSPLRLHIQDRQKIVQAQRADLMSPALARNLVLAMESSGVRRKHPAHRVGNVLHPNVRSGIFVFANGPFSRSFHGKPRVARYLLSPPVALSDFHPR